jgi:hypothetical protein
MVIVSFSPSSRSVRHQRPLAVKSLDPALSRVHLIFAHPMGCSVSTRHARAVSPTPETVPTSTTNSIHHNSRSMHNAQSTFTHTLQPFCSHRLGPERARHLLQQQAHMPDRHNAELATTATLSLLWTPVPHHTLQRLVSARFGPAAHVSSLLRRIGAELYARCTTWLTPTRCSTSSVIHSGAVPSSSHKRRLWEGPATWTRGMQPHLRRLIRDAGYRGRVTLSQAQIQLLDASAAQEAHIIASPRTVMQRVRQAAVHCAARRVTVPAAQASDECFTTPRSPQDMSIPSSAHSDTSGHAVSAPTALLPIPLRLSRALQGCTPHAASPGTPRSRQSAADNTVQDSCPVQPDVCRTARSHPIQQQQQQQQQRQHRHTECIGCVFMIVPVLEEGELSASIAPSSPTQAVPRSPHDDSCFTMSFAAASTMLEGTGACTPMNTGDTPTRRENRRDRHSNRRASISWYDICSTFETPLSTMTGMHTLGHPQSPASGRCAHAPAGHSAYAHRLYFLPAPWTCAITATAAAPLAGPDERVLVCSAVVYESVVSSA